ncbi:MAG: hypothetical protein WD877_00725 [Candidatus Saccharimonadales bacterium]
MAQLHVRRDPYGWRVYIEDGDREIMLDGYHRNEFDAAQAALSLIKK